MNPPPAKDRSKVARPDRFNAFVVIFLCLLISISLILNLRHRPGTRRHHARAHIHPVPTAVRPSGPPSSVENLKLTVLTDAWTPPKPQSPPVDLAAAARSAGAAIRKNQQRGGYWLALHTPVPQFAGSGAEVSICLTSVLVHVLDPLASAGLSDVLKRARRFLAGEIEDTGLVRYYGRPEERIPDPGCTRLPPDADDTSLAWGAVAPGGDPKLLGRALAAFKKHRTSEGLYQTWLAEPNELVCFNPGGVPNPADVGVQLHVYTLLTKTDPAAARELCSNMEGKLADERMWIYYRVAPIDLVLRQSELRRTGCAARLPEDRLRTSVAGQEPWLAAARLLERFDGEKEGRPRSEEARALLDMLARDGFKGIRENPPLVYHNDVSAPIPQFFWSEDFGYALWLRLYTASRLARG